MLSSRPRARAPPSVAASRAAAAGRAVGSPPATLGQQRRAVHLAEQAQLVVAGSAVRAQGDVDASGVQGRHWTKAAGELEIGFRAVRHVDASGGDAGDFIGFELGHMHRDQVGREQAQTV